MAWEHLDAAAAALFAQDAEYRDEPFGPPQRLQRVMRVYWNNVALMACRGFPALKLLAV